MTIAYSEATFTAAVKTALETVTNVGMVHDYERFVTDWNALVALMSKSISGTVMIRGWSIQWMGISQSVISFQGGGTANTILVNHTYRIRGFGSVDDANASEKAWRTLALAVCAALEASVSLTSDVLERDTPVVASCETDYKMFCGVLCHYAEIIVNPQEVV